MSANVRDIDPLRRDIGIFGTINGRNGVNELNARLLTRLLDRIVDLEIANRAVGEKVRILDEQLATGKFPKDSKP